MERRDQTVVADRRPPTSRYGEPSRCASNSRRNSAYDASTVGMVSGDTPKLAIAERMRALAISKMPAFSSGGGASVQG